jgi:hypothetical protein
MWYQFVSRIVSLFAWDKFSDAQICNAKMALFSVLKLDGLDAVWSVLPQKERERQQRENVVRMQKLLVAEVMSKKVGESYGKGKM